VAAQNGHTEIVKALLEHGADVNLANKVSVGGIKRCPFKALALIFSLFLIKYIQVGPCGSQLPTWEYFVSFAPSFFVHLIFFRALPVGNLVN
jgi:hypothetical protein